MKPPETAKFNSVPQPRRQPVAWMRGVSRYFDVGHRFGRALTKVSFEVGRGEVFGLLGPAGAGKSTVLRILAGRLSPSGGEAKVFGRSPRRRATSARVGYLPQLSRHSQAHFFWAAIGFLRDVFAARSGDSHSRFAGGARGEDRCTVLKQALMKDPELVLLDEPFAGLDAAGCGEMKELIRDMAQRGKTIILTSNSVSHARDVCHRVAVLYQGGIEAIGTIEAMLSTSDGLRLLGQLLPAETAEHALRAVREALGVPKLSGNTSANTPATSPKGPNADAVAVHDVSAPAVETLLAPLMKWPTQTPACPDEAPGTVNHELLAALAKPPSARPPPAAEETATSPE